MWVDGFGCLFWAVVGVVVLRHLLLVEEASRLLRVCADFFVFFAVFTVFAFAAPTCEAWHPCLFSMPFHGGTNHF